VKRHDIDVISLVCGLLFTGLGALFALHALDVFSVDVRAVPAVVLIVLGIGGIAAALTSSARSAPPNPAGPAEPAGRPDVDAGSSGVGASDAASAGGSRDPRQAPPAGVGEVAGPPVGGDL
jgi:hypothetical protein